MDILQAIKFFPYYIVRASIIAKFIIKLVLKNTNIYRKLEREKQIIQTGDQKAAPTRLQAMLRLLYLI